MMLTTSYIAGTLHEQVACADRALTQFEAAGLVTRHHFEGVQAVFELERGPHHDHIVCVHCGRIEEYYDEAIEKRQRAIAGQHNRRQEHMTNPWTFICGTLATHRQNTSAMI